MRYDDSVREGKISAAASLTNDAYLRLEFCVNLFRKQFRRCLGTFFFDNFKLDLRLGWYGSTPRGIRECSFDLTRI